MNILFTITKVITIQISKHQLFLVAQSFHERYLATQIIICYLLIINLSDLALFKKSITHEITWILQQRKAICMIVKLLDKMQE